MVMDDAQRPNADIPVHLCAGARSFEGENEPGVSHRRSSLPLDCALRTYPHERAVHSPLDRLASPVGPCWTDERCGQRFTSFLECLWPFNDAMRDAAIGRLSRSADSSRTAPLIGSSGQSQVRRTKIQSSSQRVAPRF
jgi:hypothetical protein